MWVTMAGKDEKFVTMSVLHEMLEQQKTFYKDLEDKKKASNHAYKCLWILCLPAWIMLLEMF